MNCPRCKSPIAPLANPDAIITCPGCGSRLMTKSAARRSQGGQSMLPPETPPAPSSPPAPTRPSALGNETIAPTVPAPRPRPAPVSVTPRPSAPPVPASQTLPPPTAAEAPAARREATPPPPTAIDQVLREIRAVRETQERILSMLESSLYGGEPGEPGASGGTSDEPFGALESDAPSLAPIRASSRKSVLLIDDDPKSREAAVRELTQADVPTRAVADGNHALRAIVEEKPDVIALELGLRGDMGGKDLINVIKATMEWVDIPIVLWTREPVSSQKEARQIHGADEVALKSAGPAGLLARVITIFRRG